MFPLPNGEPQHSPICTALRPQTVISTSQPASWGSLPGYCINPHAPSGPSCPFVHHNIVTLFSIHQPLQAAATHSVSTHPEYTRTPCLFPAPSVSLVFPNISTNAEEPLLKDIPSILQISFYSFLPYQKTLLKETCSLPVLAFSLNHLSSKKTWDFLSLDTDYPPVLNFHPTCQNGPLSAFPWRHPCSQAQGNSYLLIKTLGTKFLGGYL